LQVAVEFFGFEDSACQGDEMTHARVTLSTLALPMGHGRGPDNRSTVAIGDRGTQQ